MSFVLLGILNSQDAGGVIPASLNPDLWLDASDASTITESGGSVSQWDNKGSLENFSQATSANQPTTGTRTLNGLNVIDFSGDFLSGSTLSQWKFLSDGTQFFVAAAMQFDDPSGGRGDAWGNNAGGGSGNVGYLVDIDDETRNNGIVTVVTNGTPGDGPVTILDPGFFSVDTSIIFSSLLDPNNITAAQRIDYFQNNIEGTQDNSATGTPSASNPSFNLDIGASGNGFRPLNGFIAELIIVSGGNATEENRQAVVDYLNEKWSVF